MKVTFFSNFFNHHQEEISLEFIRQGIDYTFVATEPIPKERLNLGYQDINKKYDFILTTYDSIDNYNKAINLANESDIVIIGSAPEEFILERKRQNKIIYRYSERIFKEGKYKIKNIRILLYLLRNHTRYKNRNIYMLCSSAYTADDFHIAGAYKKKCYKWGYFPKAIEYDINELMSKKEGKKIKIIWVGRFINWKHPELAIELAQNLKELSYNFEITMIGNGELFEEIKSLIKKLELEKIVKVIGAIPSKDVRKYMEEANIHIFTSDQNEGWGAVLNESMNSGCAVVANKNIGAVPYLIKDKQNGCVYSSRKEFFSKVINLIENKELRENISINAYNTIKNTWNAKNAVKNLIQLHDCIVNEKTCIIKDGPCSIDK